MLVLCSQLLLKPFFVLLLQLLCAVSNVPHLTRLVVLHTMGVEQLLQIGCPQCDRSRLVLVVVRCNHLGSLLFQESLQPFGLRASKPKGLGLRHGLWEWAVVVRGHHCCPLLLQNCPELCCCILYVPLIFWHLVPKTM